MDTVHHCIQKSNLKLYHLQRKPNVNQIQKSCCLLRAFRLDYSKPENYPVVWWIKIGILSGNHRSCVLKAEEGRCHQFNLKPASATVWGSFSVHDMGNLYICSGTLPRHRLLQESVDPKPLSFLWDPRKQLASSASSPVYFTAIQRFDPVMPALPSSWTTALLTKPRYLPSME